ncbi:MAG: 2-hydroxy-3-oxopropionate reductase [Litorilinea sp.]|nr:MAG: 2-hydroxy-3-oxopropionate reductase [Litorilinea sp.]
MSNGVTVGFIGLGIMGAPMAHNVLKAGFPLVVFDLMEEAMAPLVAAGATAGSSPRSVAEAADVVLLCLPDSGDVQAALAGPNGVFEGVSPGQILVDMSSISPVVARELAAAAAARDVVLLDAPVSGGQAGAVAGTLSIMVGGDAQALEQVKPILQAMGKTIVHVGGPGAGQVAKVCNQIVIAVTIEAVAEALVLAARAGVDPALVREALLGGYAYSRVLEGHGERFLQHHFEPGFKTRLQVKDLNIALETGRSYGVPLLGTALVHQLYMSLMARGKGEADHAILVTLLEELAGQALDQARPQ